MANPRQRRKARSSSYKPVQHSRRGSKVLKKHPPIKGPKALQDAWNNHKTVRQNYAALGLLHTLTPNDSGGRDITHQQQQHDRPESDPIAGPRTRNEESGSSAPLPLPAASRAAVTEQRKDDDRDATTTTPASGAGKKSKLPRGFGKIVRDEAGNVVSIELGETETESLMEEEEWVGVVGRQPESWLLGNGNGNGAPGGGEVDVVRALEETVAKAGGKRARGRSDGEEKYLARLEEVHGEDFGAMARDVRLNPMQYTAGQLRRAFCMKA